MGYSNTDVASPQIWPSVQNYLAGTKIFHLHAGFPTVFKFKFYGVPLTNYELLKVKVKIIIVDVT